jgi:hypothetical protein
MKWIYFCGVAEETQGDTLARTGQEVTFLCRGQRHRPLQGPRQAGSAPTLLPSYAASAHSHHSIKRGPTSPPGQEGPWFPGADCHRRHRRRRRRRRPCRSRRSSFRSALLFRATMLSWDRQARQSAAFLEPGSPIRLRLQRI